MPVSTFLSDFLNFAISALIGVSALLLLQPLRKQKFDSVDKAFIRVACVALSLYAIRSVGHSVIYLHRMTAFARDEPIDLTLLLLVDIFTICSLWAWATLLRAPTEKIIWTTFEHVIAACVFVVTVDTTLFFQHSSWVLVPSAVLNALSVGFAVGAAAFRYRRYSIPLVVAYISYNFLQIQAYKSAFSLNGSAAIWVFYLLALGKGVNFVLFIGLILKRPLLEKRERTLLSFVQADNLKGVWGLVALVAGSLWAALNRIAADFPDIKKNSTYFSWTSTAVWMTMLIAGLIEGVTRFSQSRKAQKLERDKTDPGDHGRGLGAGA